MPPARPSNGRVREGLSADGAGMIRLLVAFLLVPALASGGQDRQDVRYEFVQSGNGYAFRGQFVLEAERRCIVDVLFDFDHVAKFTPDARSIEMVQQGRDWYDVTYKYRRFLILENESTWRRTLKREEDEVAFELLSSRNNRGIMPDLTSSSGYYRVRDERGRQVVEYFQECTLGAGSLKGRYIAEARTKAIEFLQGLSVYLARTCR